MEAMVTYYWPKYMKNKENFKKQKNIIKKVQKLILHYGLVMKTCAKWVIFIRYRRITLAK